MYTTKVAWTHQIPPGGLYSTSDSQIHLKHVWHKSSSRIMSSLKSTRMGEDDSKEASTVQKCSQTFLLYSTVWHNSNAIRCCLNHSSIKTCLTSCFKRIFVNIQNLIMAVKPFHGDLNVIKNATSNWFTLFPLAWDKCTAL